MAKFKKEDINLVTEIIKNGGVVSFATETVYGLGVIYDNEEAFKRLVEVKRRSPDKPFSMMLWDASEIKKYAEIEIRQKKIIDKFMPGEITLLLNSKSLPNWVTLSTNILGVRVPNDDFVRDLIKAVGKPMLVTSANRSGSPVFTKFEDVCKEFEEDVDAIVEGECVSNLPSTIIDMTKDDIKIIRAGSISEREVLEALK